MTQTIVCSRSSGRSRIAWSAPATEAAEDGSTSRPLPRQQPTGRHDRLVGDRDAEPVRLPHRASACQPLVGSPIESARE